MKTTHSTKWKASVQPRKQRKYLHKLPYHLKAAQLSIHLSTELREKHGMRALRVRTGDKVRVLRGTHKGKEGKVERVDVRRARIYVTKVETTKLQGGSAKYPLQPSNCLLLELVSDKRRFKHSDGKTGKAATKAAAAAPPVTASTAAVTKNV
jgi:large subunit ribosomal protein L24